MMNAFIRGSVTWPLPVPSLGPVSQGEESHSGHRSGLGWLLAVTALTSPAADWRDTAPAPLPGSQSQPARRQVTNEGRATGDQRV